jgi:ferredoxin-NADP reductase
VSGEPGFDLRVTARDQVAADVVALTMARRDGGELPAWTPGAHVDVVLTPDLVRQYSLCGDPADRSVFRVAVLREQVSRGGSHLVHDAVEVGDVLTVRGPRNHFPLADAPRHLFLAGGIGITPILPMVAAAHARGSDWRLVYGGRTRESMAFRTLLCQTYPGRVDVLPQDETGLLPLAELLASPDPDTLVYCCGPEPLLAAVEAATAHWPSGSLHVERFAPRPDAGTGVDGDFKVELASSGRTVLVPEGRSILDALGDAGVQVLSSCREGTCGTCETGVLAGVPEHRDSLLTEAERAVGDVMMICVSRSRGERLVLDL